MTNTTELPYAPGNDIRFLAFSLSAAVALNARRSSPPPGNAVCGEDVRGLCDRLDAVELRAERVAPEGATSAASARASFFAPFEALL